MTKIPVVVPIKNGRRRGMIILAAMVALVVGVSTALRVDADDDKIDLTAVGLCDALSKGKQTKEWLAWCYEGDYEGKLAGPAAVAAKGQVIKPGEWPEHLSGIEPKSDYVKLVAYRGYKWWDGPLRAGAAFFAPDAIEGSQIKTYVSLTGSSELKRLMNEPKLQKLFESGKLNLAVSEVSNSGEVIEIMTSIGVAGGVASTILEDYSDLAHWDESHAWGVTVDPEFVETAKVRELLTAAGVKESTVQTVITYKGAVASASIDSVPGLSPPD